MRKFAQCALLMVIFLVMGIFSVSADEVVQGDQSADQPIVVVAQTNDEWGSIKELVIIVMGGLVSLGTLFVLYRSSPADFSDKALESVSKLITELTDYKRNAELTPNKIDDLAAYLALFTAEQIQEALRRQTEQPPETPVAG